MYYMTGIAYIISFIGMVVSTIKLGVNGDWLWGVWLLIFAVVQIIIRVATGNF